LQAKSWGDQGVSSPFHYDNGFLFGLRLSTSLLRLAKIDDSRRLIVQQLMHPLMIVKLQMGKPSRAMLFHLMHIPGKEYSVSTRGAAHGRPADHVLLG